MVYDLTIGEMFIMHKVCVALKIPTELLLRKSLSIPKGLTDRSDITKYDLLQ